MTIAMSKLQNQQLSTATSVTFTYDEQIQQYMAGLAYFKLSYGDDHNYEVTKMSTSLSSTPTGNDGTQMKTSITAILKDNKHSIDLSESYVSLSAIAVIGSGIDANVQLGTVNNISSGPSGSEDTKICNNASDPVQAASVMMSGFNMGYSDAHHRVWYVDTNLQQTNKQNDGLYATITGYFSSDGSEQTDVNTFDLVGITTSSSEDPPLLIKTWKGQSPDDDVTIKFDDVLKPGYVIDAVRVFISDFYVVYDNRDGLSSTDHEVTAVGAGCTEWSGSGGTHATLATPYAFIYQTGHGDDTQDDTNSYVELVIVATQRPS